MGVRGRDDAMERGWVGFRFRRVPEVWQRPVEWGCPGPSLAMEKGARAARSRRDPPDMRRSEMSRRRQPSPVTPNPTAAWPRQNC